MKTSIRKITKMLLLFVMLAAMALPAQAAKKVSANPNYKKAPQVKMGTTKVVAKKNDSYVKFKAPAAGTYKITISNISSLEKKGSDINLGNFYIGKSNSYGVISETVKTQGGKNNCLFTATKYSYDHFYKNKPVTSNLYLASRYGQIKLKAGEDIYMQYYFTGKSCTYTLKIQKTK